MATAYSASEEAGVSVPPRDSIVRALNPGFEIRSAEDGTRTLAGHFAVFDQWTEIRSAWEGNFLERIAPGAFKKTLSENSDRIKVLFDHGMDPSIGNKPLGSIRSLQEDSQGAAYEVDLFDTSYVRDLLPALEAGTLGASFRFSVVREDREDKPKPSSFNPRGLPERTIREARVMEFGPVTFPAYPGATAGVRSATDEYIAKRFMQQPDLVRALFNELLPNLGEHAPSDHAAPDGHLEAERRDPEQSPYAAWKRREQLTALLKG